MKNASLSVVNQEDFAIAIGVISVLGCYISIRLKNDEAAIGGDVASERAKPARTRSQLGYEWIGGGAGYLTLRVRKCAKDEHKRSNSTLITKTLLHKIPPK